MWYFVFVCLCVDGGYIFVVFVWCVIDYVGGCCVNGFEGCSIVIDDVGIGLCWVDMVGYGDGFVGYCCLVEGFV